MHVVFDSFFHFITICSFFHVSLSIIYQLFLQYHVLYILFFLNIIGEFFFYQFSFNILHVRKTLVFFKFISNFNDVVILCDENKTGAIFKTNVLCLSNNFILTEMPRKKKVLF